jgi:hypothetical protein
LCALEGAVRHIPDQGRGKSATEIRPSADEEAFSVLQTPVRIPVEEAKTVKNRPTLSKVLEWGGIVAGVIMIAFGAAAIYLGYNGRSTVHDNLHNEFIVGSADMTTSAIQQEIDQIIRPAQEGIAAAREKAGVPAVEFTPLSAPSCSVANKAIDNGTTARCFAQYLRLHALRSTSGLTYSQMGRYRAKENAPVKETDFAGGTDNPLYAQVDPKTNQPIDNGTRDLWVTATALSSALNLAYTAEQIALFGVVVGVALLLTGVGLIILAVAVLHAPKERSAAAEPAPPRPTT